MLFFVSNCNNMVTVPATSSLPRLIAVRRKLRLVAARDINSSQHFKRRIMSLVDALLQVSSFHPSFFLYYYINGAKQHTMDLYYILESTL